jgi:hypothetical protein
LFLQKLLILVKCSLTIMCVLPLQPNITYNVCTYVVSYSYDQISLIDCTLSSLPNSVIVCVSHTVTCYVHLLPLYVYFSPRKKTFLLHVNIYTAPGISPKHTPKVYSPLISSPPRTTSALSPSMYNAVIMMIFCSAQNCVYIPVLLRALTK